MEWYWILGLAIFIGFLCWRFWPIEEDDIVEVNAFGKKIEEPRGWKPESMAITIAVGMMFSFSIILAVVLACN